MLASQRRALDWMLNDAGATQGHDHPVAVCLFRRVGRYRPREFGIDESDGSPEGKEGRPKHQPPGYQACRMAR